MKTLYCCHAILDQTEEPDWVEKLSNHPLLQQERWALYRPTLGFIEQLNGNTTLLASLSRSIELSEPIRTALKLDPDLLEPLGKVVGRLERSDHHPSLDVAFKRLYALLRSDIMLVDMNEPDHGCRSQEVMYAYLSNVPIVGIAHRFILSPSMVGRVGTVIFPRTSDEIVRQVLAHDHKVTATLQYYRMRAQKIMNERVDEVVAGTIESTEPADGEDESACSVS